MARATTDIAVIGGGIMGMSIAYQVARRSKRRVVVLDKGAGLGEGSTGGSAAITRQRYSQPELIRLSRDGNAVFKQWAEYLGLGAPRAEYHESRRAVDLRSVAGGGRERPRPAAGPARRRGRSRA